MAGSASSTSAASEHIEHNVNSLVGTEEQKRLCTRRETCQCTCAIPETLLVLDLDVHEYTVQCTCIHCGPDVNGHKRCTIMMSPVGALMRMNTYGKVVCFDCGQRRQDHALRQVVS